MGIVSQRKEYKKLKTDSIHIKMKKKEFQAMKFVKKNGTEIELDSEGIELSKNTPGGTQVGVQ